MLLNCAIIIIHCHTCSWGVTMATPTVPLALVVDLALNFGVRSVLIHLPGTLEPNGDISIQETLDKISTLSTEQLYLQLATDDKDLEHFCSTKGLLTMILTEAIPATIASNTECFRENNLWLPTAPFDMEGLNLRFDSTVLSLADADEIGFEENKVFEWYQLPRGPKTSRQVGTWRQDQGLTPGEPSIWKRRSDLEGAQLKCAVANYPPTLLVKKTETGELKVYGFTPSVIDGLRVNK